jgi:hypothetical protein
MKVKALAVAAALVISGAANAVGPGFLGNLDNSTVTIENTIFSPGAPLSFSDEYTFSVSDIAFAEGDVLNLRLNPIIVLPGPEWNLSFDEISFVDLSTSAVLASDTDASDGFSLSAVLPHSGFFRFIVEGTTSGNFGGRYEGELTVTLTPIPEPSTYALLLAGLGVVGFVAKQRRRQ